MSNVVNSNVRAVTSIEYGDDLPFSELINSVPIEEKNIDIILVTPGGSGTQVAKFVDKLRPRFENVSFIIPDIAMSVIVEGLHEDCYWFHNEKDALMFRLKFR